MRKKKRKLSWIAECLDSKKGHYMVWVFDKVTGENLFWRHLHTDDLIMDAETLVAEAQ